MSGAPTVVPAGAKAIQGLVDGKDGILSQAIRAKNLSRLLMGDIEEGFRFDRARKIEDDLLTFLFRKDGIDTTLWLMSELWDAAHNIAQQIDALSEAVNDIVEGAQ